MKTTTFSLTCSITMLFIAIIADVWQVFIYTGQSPPVSPAARELGLIALDYFVLCVTIGMLGFHWVLIPTAFMEADPGGLYVFPIWTATIAFMVWNRKRSQPPRAHRIIIDDDAEIIDVPPTGNDES